MSNPVGCNRVFIMSRGQNQIQLPGCTKCSYPEQWCFHINRTDGSRIGLRSSHLELLYYSQKPLLQLYQTLKAPKWHTNPLWSQFRRKRRRRWTGPPQFEIWLRSHMERVQITMLQNVHHCRDVDRTLFGVLGVTLQVGGPLYAKGLLYSGYPG